MEKKKSRKTSDGDGKGDTTGEGPKGISPSGKSNKPACFHLLRAMPNGTHIRSLAPTSMLTLQIPKRMHMGVLRVYSITLAKAGERAHGNATIATQ